MANHKSAKKAIRQIARRTVINTARRSRVRRFIRRVEAAIAQADHGLAMKALSELQSEILRAVARGVFTLNKASRKISRLNARVKALVHPKTEAVAS
jgi:small subunit ribosomal protein S20